MWQVRCSGGGSCGGKAEEEEGWMLQREVGCRSHGSCIVITISLNKQNTHLQDISMGFFQDNHTTSQGNRQTKTLSLRLIRPPAPHGESANVLTIGNGIWTHNLPRRKKKWKCGMGDAPQNRTHANAKRKQTNEGRGRKKREEEDTGSESNKKQQYTIPEKRHS